MQDLANAIGAALKAERERQGLTQQALASKAGISMRTVTRYELGGGGVQLATLSAVAEALGIEAHTLLARPSVAAAAPP